jgi:hypothetical protein
MKLCKNILIVTGLCILGACSSSPRKPSSTIYTCHFSEKIGDTVKQFEFIPDDHSLLVDKADVALEESDFATGGYIYKTFKKEKDWKAELVFMSYEPKARVYLKLLKSPVAAEPVTIIKDCE